MGNFVNKFAKNKEDEKKKEAAELSNEAKYLKEIVELLEEERLQDSENKREKDTKTTVKE